MAYEELGAKLANRTRIGLSDELAEKLGVKSEEAIGGALLSVTDGQKGVFGVYLLAVYVIDDTDFWSDFHNQMQFAPKLDAAALSDGLFPFFAAPGIRDDHTCFVFPSSDRAVRACARAGPTETGHCTVDSASANAADASG